MGLFDFFSNSVNEHHQMVYAENGNKGNLGHEILAGAAGFEALRMLEQHQATQTGQPVKHHLFRELLAGFAAAEVEKLVETHSLREKGYDVERLKEDARRNALQQYESQYGGQ
ncbi:hypothetical protein DFJ73DRAFT_843707 [Zopfochytrium polystomum]|nr:hypothetical protein DFJ73DRAFT_843707 [Zopfochytrium polystomum]